MKKLIDDWLWWEARSEDSIYLEKIKVLIARDPLTADFLRELNQYDPSQVYCEQKIYESLLGNSKPKLIKSYKRPTQLEDLKHRLEVKWNVSISITSEVNHSLQIEGKKTLLIKELFTIHHWEAKQRKESITELISDDGKLTLQFDLTLLNKSTQKEKSVKDTVWDFLKKRLDEVPELLAEKPKGYSIKKDTFNKYLKWYDLHMGNEILKPKGLQFRTIARMNLRNLIKKNCPDKLEEFEPKLNEMKNLNKKTLQNLRRDTKEPIEWEDAVEKGVKHIYKLIHGKPYPAKKKAELFNCPNHGNDCPATCKNLIQSMKIFKNRNVFKKHITSSNVDLAADPKGIQPPAKKSKRKENI